jgi:cytochrome c-type protein NapC
VSEGGERKGLIGKANAWLMRIGPVTAAGLFAAGIIFWGGFNWSFELTNTERFCISCHEMSENVFREYRHTVHYTNRSGVRATCPDCHVPKEWGPKIVRKIQASNELWHKLLGSVDTPEKFQAKRIRLAENEWARMKANDSQECRNCHHYEYMDFAEQGRRAVNTHSKAFAKGETCIDCHKGIAHQMPPIEQEIGAPKTAAMN